MQFIILRGLLRGFVWIACAAFDKAKGLLIKLNPCESKQIENAKELSLKNYQYIQILKQKKFKIIKIKYLERTISFLFEKLFNKNIGKKFIRFDRILNPLMKPRIFSYGIHIVAKK